MIAGKADQPSIPMVPIGESCMIRRRFRVFGKAVRFARASVSRNGCARAPGALAPLLEYGIAVIGYAPTVMPGLGPGIHEFARDDRNFDGIPRRDRRHLRWFSPDFAVARTDNSWMPGPRPGMTNLSLTSLGS